MQKGKLVPQEVEIAIADVTRISEAVERGTSKLFRRSMTVAVYGRTQDDLKAAAERLTSHFRASLAKINPLKFRQGRGFTALMPQLRPGVGEEREIALGMLVLSQPNCWQDRDGEA